jgi:hypothetical protein
MPDRRRTIEVDFLVDDSEKRKLTGIGDEATITGGKFDGLKGAVGGFLTVATAQQIGQFIVDVTQLGEQATIAAASASKVLGPALDGLRDDLEEVRGTMGFNRSELDETIAKFGLLTDSMGLTDDAQAEFIGWLIETGGELAAFRGDLSLSDEAVDALGATLRGEYDSLEQFGVKVSDAAIEERKLELAADPANAALSDQQLELLALQQLITEKATPAIGSLAEAQDGLAGKTNELNARFEDMKISLGERLMPVVLTLGDELIKTFDSWDRLVNAETFGNTALGSFIDNIADDVQTLIDSFRTLFDIVGDAADEVRDFFNMQPGNAPARISSGIGSHARDMTRSGPGRQHGGPVHSGNPYLVGERGPEIFVPSANGHINPGGGMTANITINAGLGADPNAISRAVVEALQRFERANGSIPVRTMGR